MQKNVIIFGSGERARNVINIIDQTKALKIKEIWDNNEKKWGQKFWGTIIKKPYSKIEDVDKIIIASVYYKEIKEQLVSELKIDQGMIEDYSYAMYPLEKRLIEEYQGSSEPEICAILKRIQANGLQTFNYDFPEKYKNEKFKVEYDDEKKMFYAIWKDKKMYFSNEYTQASKVEEYLRHLTIEQDEKSPHKYLAGKYQIGENDVIVDAGVAEGFFTLDVIDKIQKAYLIETDNKWVEALKETFRSYQDKIVIIEKFLSNEVGEHKTTLDTLLKGEKVHFIKMDIEGEESNALLGAEEVITQNENLKLAVCTYHKSHDAEEIKKILQEYGYETEFSEGYMFFQWGEELEKILRKGVIRAKR